MADILKKIREDLQAEDAQKAAKAKAEALAKKKKEAEDKARHAAWQKAQLAKEKDAAAEKQLEAAVAKQISAADSALQKAFSSIAKSGMTENAPVLLTYKQKNSNNGMTHELLLRGDKEHPLRISLRPVFNSSINKKITGIELHIDDLLNAERKEETRERVTQYGESFGLYTEPWEIEYTTRNLRQRTIYSAPSNEAIASALEKWFATAVKRNRYLADAVKSGEISGSINIGLKTPAQKPTKRTEWEVTTVQKKWREKTSEYDRHHPFGI